MLEFIEDLGTLYPKETSKRKHRFGLYKCFCGKEFKSIMLDVKNLKVKSCGCLKLKHGLTKHRLFHVWDKMLQRCFNEKNKAYKNYGARGITVCKRWLNVANFIKDMYPSYQEGLSIDRINNNGNYEPSNCRWTTRCIQSRNTRKLRIDNTSGYRGVIFAKTNKKWCSQISINKKHFCLGHFSTAIEAAKAYDQYVIDNNLEHTRNFS